MAREKSAWERFREREKTRLEQEAQRLQKDAPSQKGAVSAPTPLRPGSAPLTPDQVTLDLVHQCEILIEQITNLYQMYVAGMERLPPLTQRKHLDNLILKIQASSRAARSTQFQVNQFLTKHSMYKDRWDKLVRDIEAGRVVIRKKGAAGR